ncbi:acyl-CoA synthetase [Alcanivorax sp. ZXX171]|nr:acyl-CoA synthetase [Alcanivorax sp. ZXX171]
MMLTRADTYAAVRNAFRWTIPEFYGMADDISDRRADHQPDKAALIVRQDGVAPRYLTFAEIRRDANRLANWLVSAGLEQGDQVSILLSQTPETAISHVVCWKADMVSPISILFSSGAIGYRLRDLESRVVVKDRENLPKIQAVADQAQNRIGLSCRLSCL